MFVIITAKKLEYEAVQACLNGVSPSQHAALYTHCTGHLNDNSAEVAVCCLEGMGNTNSAGAFAQILNDLKPEAVILAGIIGGVKKTGCQIGDVLIADKIIGYEPGKHTADGLQRRYEPHRPSFRLLNEARWFSFPADSLSTDIRRPLENQMPQIYWGSIASGEKVIADEEVLAELVRDWPDLIGVEMEGIGAAHVSYKNEFPAFLLIKSVSDFADPGKNDNWQPYAAHVSARYSTEFIKYYQSKHNTRWLYTESQKISPAADKTDEYRCHIFLSYSYETDLKARQGWVPQFINDLRDRLEHKFGYDPKQQVDGDLKLLASYDKLPRYLVRQEVDKFLCQSKILLVLLSQGYINHHWSELQHYRKNIQAGQRIFILITEPVFRLRLTEEQKQILDEFPSCYAFYAEYERGCFDFLEPSESMYNSAISYLAQDLTDVINSS